MEITSNKRAVVKDSSLIKIAEIKKGLKGYQVAELVGVSKTYYSQVITGFYKYCSYELAENICNVLDLKFNDVFKEI